MEKIDREFKKCPACGSERTFFKHLAKEAEQNNLAPKDWKLAFLTQKGAAVEQSHATVLPVGTAFTSYFVATDICLDCGNIYAVHILTGEGKVQAPLIKPKMPITPPFIKG